MEPIKPSEVLRKHIPDFVIEAMNELLMERGADTYYLEEVVQRILAKAPPGTTKAMIFKNNWCDFEPLYRKAGWKVEFDTPDMYSTGQPLYRFREQK